MKKTILITSMIALFCGASFAQPTGEQAQEEQAQAQEEKQSTSTGSLSFLREIDELAAASSNVDKSADDYIKAKFKSEGFDSESGRYVAKGYANVKSKPSDKTFETARAKAFLEAMADVKSAIANYYGQKIQTILETIYSEPESADAQIRKAEAEAAIEPSLLKKYTDLLNAKLDKELKKEGITYASPKAKIIIKDLLSSKSLESSIKRSASHQVGGLVTSKIYEEDGEIAVVAYYSPNTLLLAGAINGQKVLLPILPKRQGKPVEQWIQDLTIEQLYLSQGVQVTTDGDGNIVLISYAVSSAVSNSGDSKKAAKDKADMQAAANIRRFAGELVVTSSSKEDTINSIEIDGEESTTTLSDIESSYASRTKLVASKLNIPGITKVRDWSFVDPRSNKLVCGVVSIWSIETGVQALEQKDLAKKLATPAGGFKGAEKVKVIKIDTVKEDTSNKYRGESIESDTL